MRLKKTKLNKTTVKKLFKNGDNKVKIFAELWAKNGLYYPIGEIINKNKNYKKYKKYNIIIKDNYINYTKIIIAEV